MNKLLLSEGDRDDRDDRDKQTKLTSHMSIESFEEDGSPQTQTETETHNTVESGTSKLKKKKDKPEIQPTNRMRLLNELEAKWEAFPQAFLQMIFIINGFYTVTYDVSPLVLFSGFLSVLTISLKFISLDNNVCGECRTITFLCVSLFVSHLSTLMCLCVSCVCVCVCHYQFLCFKNKTVCLEYTHSRMYMPTEYHAERR